MLTHYCSREYNSYVSKDMPHVIGEKRHNGACIAFTIVKYIKILYVCQGKFEHLSTGQ